MLSPREENICAMLNELAKEKNQARRHRLADLLGSYIVAPEQHKALYDREFWRLIYAKLQQK